MKGHYSEREAAKLTKTIEELLRLAILLGSCTDILSLRTSCLILLRKMLPSRPLILGCLFSTSQANLLFFDVVRSPYYVAPEVLRKHYGPETNVWSADFTRENRL